jgi:hypothetical protein
MTKLVFSLLCFLAIGAAASAEVTGQTTLVPLEVFVGDNALIRFSFSAPVRFSFGEGTAIDIPTANSVFATLEPDYTVTGVFLSQNGADYVLTIRFTPWKTGNFDIPPFDINKLLGVDEPNIVDIAPVMVASLVQKQGVTQLRPSSPPILIPGTTYILLILSLGVLAVLILAPVFIVRFQKSHKSLSALFGPLFFSAPGKKALTRLKKLQKHTDALIFAGDLEAVLRDYLEAHFAWPFSAASAPEIFPAFAEITNGMLDSAPFAEIEKLDALFRRCDYIRYSGAPHGTLFTGGELLALAGDAKAAVVFFEKGE